MSIKRDGKIHTMTTRELCEHLNLQSTQVHDMIAEGMPVYQRAEGRGGGRTHRFRLRDVVGWMTQKQLKAAVKSAQGEVISVDEAKRRKLAAEASIQEIALAKARGDVIDLDEVRRQLANRFAQVRAAMRKIPERSALRVVGETDEIKIKAVIREEVDAVLEALSEGIFDGQSDN